MGETPHRYRSSGFLLRCLRCHQHSDHALHRYQGPADLTRLAVPPEPRDVRAAISPTPALWSLFDYRHTWTFGGVSFETERGTTKFKSPNGDTVAIACFWDRGPRIAVSVDGEQVVSAAKHAREIDDKRVREIVAFGLAAMNWLAEQVVALERLDWWERETQRQREAEAKRRGTLDRL